MKNNINNYEVFSKSLPIDREMFDDLVSALFDRALLERLTECGFIKEGETTGMIIDLDNEILEYYRQLCDKSPDKIVEEHFVALTTYVEMVRDEKWKSVA